MGSSYFLKSRAWLQQHCGCRRKMDPQGPDRDALLLPPLHQKLAQTVSNL